jgi:prevent-host-death family protein
MCVIMSDPKVGVRELRQNLSVYLRRVKAGEALEVTDRGNVVALLVPLPDPDTPLDRLVASGRATRPVGSLAELNPPAGDPTTWLTRALQEEREERS